MRNIFLIPTNKPSRLYKKLGRELKYDTKYFEQKGLLCINQNIFITSDEEIKEGDFVYDFITQTVYQLFEKPTKNEFKIILTTDLVLQKDGVQEIPDEFLEWFVKNPSCEEIEVFYQDVYSMGKWDRRYGIIIPKEDEPKQEFSDKNYTPELELLGKQETLEETNKSLLDIRAEILNSYSSGIKTIGEIDLLLNQYVEIINKERNYSEDEVLNLLVKINYCPTTLEGRIEVKDWFEQHKKKL